MGMPKVDPMEVFLFESEQARTDHVVETAKELWDQDEELRDLTSQADFQAQLWDQIITWEDTMMLKGKRITVFLLAWLND